MNGEPGAVRGERPQRSPLAFFQLRNAVTYAGVGAALMAGALAGDPSSRGVVGQCLAVATLADLFDGRFARLFRGSDRDRRFGMELDSLADALSFGLAPVLCLFRYRPPVSGLLGWVWLACGLAYVLCALTRLAYYNITTAEQPGFVGVPTTVFGVFWSAWLLFEPSAVATMVALVLGGLAMVSPIRIARPGAKVLLVIAAVAVGLLFAHGLIARGSHRADTPLLEMPS
jgi:CDP-diacylglycerol---serine O-phosphatidyltransferase